MQAALIGPGILAKALAGADVKNGDGEEQASGGDENQVEHLDRIMERGR
jgi:hypothetical protein